MRGQSLLQTSCNCRGLSSGVKVTRFLAGGRGEGLGAIRGVSWRSNALAAPRRLFDELRSPDGHHSSPWGLIRARALIEEDLVSAPEVGLQRPIRSDEPLAYAEGPGIGSDEDISPS